MAKAGIVVETTTDPEGVERVCRVCECCGGTGKGLGPRVVWVDDPAHLAWTAWQKQDDNIWSVFLMLFGAAVFIGILGFVWLAEHASVPVINYFLVLWCVVIAGIFVARFLKRRRCRRNLDDEFPVFNGVESVTHRVLLRT